jgi:hypothetical protein
MADASDSTLAKRRKRLDHLKFEDIIAGTRDAVVILELILQSLNGCRVKDPSNPGVIGGFTVLYLSEDQDRALYAASSHAYDAARALEEAFYADVAT